MSVLYLLSSLYKNVFIMKPETSRIANSEKYIICKGYKINDDKELYKTIISSYSNVINNDYIHLPQQLLVYPNIYERNHYPQNAFF